MGKRAKNVAVGSRARACVCREAAPDARRQGACTRTHVARRDGQLWKLVGRLLVDERLVARHAVDVQRAVVHLGERESVNGVGAWKVRAGAGSECVIPRIEGSVWMR
eukprot:363257-Chlamydomonas_euryale.AAC.17